ncbi:Lsr2 family DNA-binding protein [Pseudonocardia sediminis]
MADREQNRAIREWAVRCGMKVVARGRIPSDVSPTTRRTRAIR